MNESTASVMLSLVVAGSAAALIAPAIYRGLPLPSPVIVEFVLLVSAIASAGIAVPRRTKARGMFAIIAAVAFVILLVAVVA